MNTPDTELKKWFEANYLDGDEVQEGQMLASSECLDALLSRDTYWKERVADINKSFVDFMEAFVENGDNAIDLESLEEWRQHTLLDNLK